MPIHSGKEKGKCYEQYGHSGKKYFYTCGHKVEREHAKKKAIAQAIAAGASKEELVSEKISFDYDGTLTLSKIKSKAQSLISSGADVYIISARHSKYTMLAVADKLGIPHSRVYATGSNKEKVKKILSLGITKHYDNNPDVIKELGSIGSLIQNKKRQETMIVIRPKK